MPDLQMLRELSERATQGRFYYSKRAFALRVDQGHGAGPILFIADDGNTLSVEQDELNGQLIAEAVNFLRDFLARAEQSGGEER